MLLAVCSNSEYHLQRWQALWQVAVKQADYRACVLEMAPY